MPALSRVAGPLTGIIVAMTLAYPVAAQDPAPPLPPPRPDQPTTSSPEVSDEKVQPKEAGAEQKASELSEAAAACLERIARLGIRFEKRPPVRENSCSVDNPVLVSGLPNGIEVAPASSMACPVAESLARWMTDAVTPEAERQFQSAATKLLIGTSYQCRDQRNGEKLSEHAFGNGVDVMGFEFAKRAPLTIATHAADSPEATFQSAVQKAACPIFTTVLGPGSDAAHGDHLHLDMRQRKGDYRICQ
jgi:hypothetical protein